ncbi:KH domain-containing protein [Lentinula edodes]|uniref:KH domain-containing protein n=1 Tax=Lentinula edodes TaxID=5353 RepID=A0A1Q3EAX3_LENED|nr:KH domain-containing protein [Lentinula edodes]
MALSAADLQKKHNMEGAPDPFAPTPEEQVEPRSKPLKQELDTNSHQAFPSLASSAPTTKPATQSAWGAANGPRIKPVINKQPVFTDSFTLGTVELTTKDNKPVTLGETIKQVMAKYKVKVEASGNQRGRQTTFHMKAESQRELDKAKRLLLALLSPIETFNVTAPISTIPTIIGPKGATLKQIRDQTGAKIDVPPKDSANGTSNGHAVGDDEDEEPSVQITVMGPKPLALEAVDLINQIVASKTSRITQRVRDIPPHVLPFILARKSVFEAAAQGSELKLQSGHLEVTASGERDAVHRALDLIKADIAELSSNLTSLKISLPKRQHRLLVGKGAQGVMAKTDLPSGLAAVMEQANSKYIHEFPLPGPVTLSKQLLEYMNRIDYPKTLSEKHPGVSIFTPAPATIDRAHSLVIDIVGDKPAVDAVVRQVSELIGKLIGATKDVSIDWLLHRIINGKNAKKIKQFHDIYNVLVYFPAESAEQSSVLLVYDPFGKAASPSPDDKAKSLDEVTKELMKMVKEAADVKSDTLQVEKRWHEAIIGQGGTTLNAIIGEDKALSIKFGVEAGDSATEDSILIRGTSADVSRAAKEILQIVENAKNDEIVNSYSTEFDIDREYVGRVVGAQGAGINKLRDQLGVRVDVLDDTDEKESGKKKKAVHHKSKVKITGRKENVEEAQKRINAQIEKLADETSEILQIPTKYHSGLIGQFGKYVIRLEENYSVKITFPRQTAENGEGKTREQLKPDEVLIKGGKKGVAGAKAELLDAVEFEKETNNVLKFTVPTRSVARILGKGGKSINEIKDTTDAQIDVEKVSDDQTNITVRGTKKAINAAKIAILAIADQVAEELALTVPVESKYHRTLIGVGGQGLKDLVSRCGGGSDPKVLANLIRFPRQGEPSNEVRLRGEPAVVNKLKVELEKAVAMLRDRVILAVEIPAAQHRALIGRGGQHLNELQDQTGAQIQFPGSRSYAHVGEPENAVDFGDVDPANIVKVTGPRAACEKAIDGLKNSMKAAAPELITSTISVPLKYHHIISQQGQFFRNLRNFGVQVDQSVQAQKQEVPVRPVPSGTTTARIDEEEDPEAPEVEWEVAPNYQNAEEGDSLWTLKARDQGGLERAAKLVHDAIEHAKGMSFIGFLTLPDRSTFPRIVGSKGANVMRIRNETGADIQVSRENSTIIIVGSENSIIAAKNAVMRLASGRPRRQHD